MVVRLLGSLRETVDEGDRLDEVLEAVAPLEGAPHLVPALGVARLVCHHSKGCRFAHRVAAAQGWDFRVVDTSTLRP
jgi:hypothetical protein